MACGNTEVSRDGVSPAQPPQHPRLPQDSGNQSALDVAQAQRSVSNAQQAVRNAPNSTAARAAIDQAEKALADARRAGAPEATVRAMSNALREIKREALALAAREVAYDRERAETALRCEQPALAAVLTRRADLRLDRSTPDPIWDYSGAGFLDINYALREGTVEMVEKIAARSASLSAAIRDVPIHAGTVIRRSNIDDAALARYQPGDVVIENFFSSSTSDPDKAREFEGNVVWIIDSKQGRDIASRSRWDEAEVLFDHFTRFEVLARDYDSESNQWVIYMEEC